MFGRHLRQRLALPDQLADALLPFGQQGFTAAVPLQRIAFAQQRRFNRQQTRHIQLGSHKNPRLTLAALPAQRRHRQPFGLLKAVNLGKPG